ncbi:MAG: hypothetical protein ACHQFX_12065 [Chitinophagales bacterium]
MKQIKLFLSAPLIATTLLIINSCSQATSPPKSAPAIFIATTPYNDIARKLLGISSDNKYDMMKWHLTLYNDPGTSANYILTCKYGMAKQGTRDFVEGAEKIELRGKWTIDKGTTENNKAVIYRLHADNSPISLSFMQPDPNLLHLLDNNSQLMVGTGAWSYTLNRTDPVRSTSIKSEMQKVSSLHTNSDSLVIGVFDGRTPCNTDLTGLNGISMPGCQIVKCRLMLYQDIKTHEPTSFQLLTVYVGKGDNRYTTTGKWKMLQGTATDPGAIIYQLEPDSGKTPSLTFLKADDNILFLLDKDGTFLVGDEYTSYTLNRGKR